MNPIEHAGRQLAQAEAILQVAQQRYQQALAEVATIESRLQAVADRRAQIRADLACGSLSDREAGGLMTLADEDMADLDALLNEAKARAVSAAPMAEEQAVALARAAIERIGREVMFNALHGRLLELERAFLEALGTLYRQGQALGRGRPLTEVYRPSDEMRRALFHGVPPAPDAMGSHHE